MINNEKRSILVIDDEKSNIIELTDILEADYDIFAIRDGRKALETAERIMPDVVLLDVIMPDMDGYEVIEALKNNKKTCDIPVIFISGLDSIDAEEKGLALGAADYVTKPFHSEIIKIRINNQIKIRERDIIKRHEKMLQAVNSVAIQLFETGGYDDMLLSLKRGMELICKLMDADRINIWRVEEADGKLNYHRDYSWFSKIGTKTGETPDVLNSPADKGKLDWEERFSRGEIINGIVSKMPENDKAFLGMLGIKSVIIIPLFLHDEFWGLFSLDDCKTEREFTGDDISILKSVSLMMVSAIDRHALSDDINKTLHAMENILNSIDINIYVTVPNTGELLFINTHMKKVFNIQGNEAIGKFCYKIFRNDLDDMCEFCPCFQLDKEPGSTIVWDEYIPEMDIHVRHSDCYINWHDGRRVHLQHAFDITALVKASEKAQAASNAKSEFLANISHEMLTPMNAIMGMTAIGKRTKDSGKKDNSFDKIEKASSNLLGIINDILDLTNVEGNKIKLSKTEFNLDKMIQNILAVIQVSADGKKQTIDVNVDKKIPSTIIGDNKRLTQVIMNVLSNAVKFSQENGKIKLDALLAKKTDDYIELFFEVTDNGIGISSEHHGKLFDIFEKVDSGLTRSQGGTGLGLSISKLIVEAMNGMIWVESELGEGTKTSFSVRVGYKD